MLILMNLHSLVIIRQVLKEIAYTSAINLKKLCLLFKKCFVYLFIFPLCLRSFLTEQRVYNHNQVRFKRSRKHASSASRLARALSADTSEITTHLACPVGDPSALLSFPMLEEDEEANPRMSSRMDAAVVVVPRIMRARNVSES